MIEINKMINDYITWLKSNITYEILDEYVKIVTPFLNRHNDSIQIYVKKIDNNNYLLTDGGETISDLSLSGIDITKNREKIITQILNRYGAQLSDDNEITIIANKDNFPFKKHFLVQAILSVNDLFMTSRTNVLNLFTEEVELFLKENKEEKKNGKQMVSKIRN